MSDHSGWWFEVVGSLDLLIVVIGGFGGGLGWVLCFGWCRWCLTLIDVWLDWYFVIFWFGGLFCGFDVCEFWYLYWFAGSSCLCRVMWC